MYFIFTKTGSLYIGLAGLEELPFQDTVSSLLIFALAPPPPFFFLGLLLHGYWVFFSLSISLTFISFPVCVLGGGGLLACIFETRSHCLVHVGLELMM